MSTDKCCATEPIDLKSKDASLPDQNFMANESPKERAMQRMINDRVGEKNDQWSGMRPRGARAD